MSEILATSTPPTVPNPSVFTDVVAQPRVDGASGAFTQKVQLDIPPGRSGLQPDVSLQYNSQQTSDSIIGYGWSLPIPYVQRLNKTGTQDFYSGNNRYFTSSVDGELASIVDATATTAPATTTPQILDTLPVTMNETGSAPMSATLSYTVPSWGSHKLLVAMIAFGAGDKSASLNVTQNGVSVTCQFIAYATRAYHHYCYLASPTSGTFSMSWTGGSGYQITLFTVKDAAQSSPIDASAASAGSGASISTNVTTTAGYDLLLDHVVGANNVTHTFGAGQTQTFMGSTADPLGKDSQSYKAAATTAGTETMTRNFSPNDVSDDLAVVAIKQFPGGTSISPSTFRGKVDDGSSLTYTFQNNVWTADDKKGTRYLFGSDDSTRQYDTGTGTSTNSYKWMLKEIRDTNSNYVTYTYTRDSNELYPSVITYTGNGSVDGANSVTFTTASRPDIRISYAPGFKVTTNNRISEVDALVNGVTKRKYLLGYGPGINGKRSLLTSVQQQGYDDFNNLTSLPAMTFTYASSSSQFYAPSSVTMPVAGQYNLIGDTNGNGINDVNYFYFDQVLGATSSSMFIDQTTQVTGTVPPNYWAYQGTPPSAQERSVRYLDINADGKADVVTSNGNNIYLNTFASSTGYSWSGTTTSGVIPSFSATGASTMTAGIFGDVNGDGLPDFEASLPSYISPTASLGNGRGWNTSSFFTPAKDFPTTIPTATASQLVDVNGDGLDDWIYSDGTNTYVLLNNGTGWNASPDTQWTIATSTLYKSTSPGTTYYDRGIRFFGNCSPHLAGSAAD